MPLTESEQAQYNAMAEALSKEQITNASLRLVIRNLRKKLDKIEAIIEEDEI